jgi:hypothetical protein
MALQVLSLPLASARESFGGRESLFRTTIRRLKAGGCQR